MNRFAFVVLCFCGYISSSVDAVNPLNLLTNSLDEELLNYYSSLPDRITDVALEGIRKYLLDHNETRINIPPVDVKFDIPLLGNVGEFNGTDGFFVNPATVVRTKETTVKWGVKSNASTAIGFTSMEITFPRYSMTTIGITETGSASVAVGRNEILLEAQVVLLPKCTIEMTRVQLTKMEDIVADITGLGLFNWLADDIVSLVLSSYETSITQIIEKVVTDELIRVMTKTNGACKVRKPTAANAKVTVLQRKLRCLNVHSEQYRCRAIYG